MITKRRGQGKPPAGTQFDYSHPQSQGLIGFWAFNEGSGNFVKDQTGRYGNGQFISGVKWGGKDPVFASASSQYVRITHNPLYSFNGKPDITFEVKFLVNSNRNYNGLMTKTNGSSSQPWDMYVNSGGGLLVFGPSGLNYNISGINPGVWYTCTFVYKGTANSGQLNSYLYLNGNLVGQNTSGGQSTITDGTKDILLGARDDLVTLLDGRIEYAKLWNRAVPVQEIAQNLMEPYAPLLIPQFHFIYINTTTNLTVSVSDTLTFSDSIVVQASNTDIPKTVTDTITFSDSIALIRGIGFTVSDSLSFVDAVNTNFFVSEIIRDFINFTDSIQRFSQFFLNIQDSIGFVDSVTIQLGNVATASVVIADSLTFTDQIFIALNLILQSVLVSDNLVFVDEVDFFLGGAFDKILIRDGITFQDDIKVVLQQSFNAYIRKYLNDYTPAPPDPGYFFQGQQTPIDYFPGQSDVSIPLVRDRVPSLPQNTTINTSVTDFLSFSDGVVVSNIIPSLGVFDAISFQDSVALSIAVPGIFISDALTFLDSISLSNPTNFIDIRDTLRFLDSITINLIPSALSINDSLNFSDSILIQIDTYSVTVADSLVFNDSISVVTTPPAGGNVNLNFVVGESPTVTGTSCTLSHVPVANTEAVYINELRARRAIDYTISGSVITFNAWNSGDNVFVDYQYLS